MGQPGLFRVATRGNVAFGDVAGDCFERHCGAIDLRHLFARQLSLLGSYMGRKPELVQASRFFFEGQLTPVVDEVMPLSAARDAQERLERHEQFGKIVLTP